MAGGAVPVVREATVVAAPIQATQAITAAPILESSVPGQMIAQAGATLGGAGDKLATTAVRMQTEDNEAAAKAGDTAFNTSLRGQLFDPEKGYFTLKGKDAVDAYKATMEAVQKSSDDVAATIANPEARRMYNDIATRRRDSALDSMAKHAAIERRTYLDGVSLARAANSAEDAVVYSGDAAKREAALNVGRNEILTFAADHGESTEVTQRKLREYDTKAYTAIVQKMAVTDPMGAQSFYEANKGKIDGTQQVTVEKFLKEATGRRQSTADADEAMGAIVTGAYADKVGGVENGGKYGGSPNASTNAGGKYQMIDATFLTHARKADPEGTAGKSDAELLILKKSDTPAGRKLQDAAMTGFTRENEAALKAADLPVNDATRYMAHWFGAAGAVKVLKADPSTPVETFFKAGKGADGKVRSAAEWAAENGIKGKTAGDIVAMAKKRMGDGTTALPGEAPVRTSTDPKEVAREMEANLSAYVERAKALYKDDPERLDKALTEIKRRYALQELQVTAQQKAVTEEAWKIAVTPDATGARPTTQDAIPPDMWVKLDPRQQEALTRQFAHNLKGTDAPENDETFARFYELNREAQSDPAAFKDRDLTLERGKLPTRRLDDLVQLQRSIVKGDAKEFKITDAMRIAAIPLKQAGFDLTGKTAKDTAVLGQFQGALQDWISQYQDQNKKPPSSADVLKHVDDMLIQGRIRGEGLFGTDKFLFPSKQVEGPASQKGTKGSKPGGTFNFQVAPASRGSFYVPFDDIPADRRERVEKALVARGLLPGTARNDTDADGLPVPDYGRRKKIEEAYGAFLAGGGK